MTSPLDEYTKQISLSLHGHPDAQALLRWNKDQSRFELVVTFNIEGLFQEYAAKGDITIQSIPPDRKIATVQFTYPIPGETALRAQHGHSAGPGVDVDGRGTRLEREVIRPNEALQPTVAACAWPAPRFSGRPRRLNLVVELNRSAVGSFLVSRF